MARYHRGLTWAGLSLINEVIKLTRLKYVSYCVIIHKECCNIIWHSASYYLASPKKGEAANRSLEGAKRLAQPLLGHLGETRLSLYFRKGLFPARVL